MDTYNRWYILHYTLLYCLCQERLWVLLMRDILSKRLKECRKERGVSQREVAIFCDITEKAYQNYELMTREPKLEILIRIADYFEVSLDYLTGRTDKKEW
ncbi:MAG: helix-turn-helix domain-containing protein [Oscillospiraceae bacterium]